MALHKYKDSIQHPYYFNELNSVPSLMRSPRLSCPYLQTAHADYSYRFQRSPSSQLTHETNICSWKPSPGSESESKSGGESKLAKCPNTALMQAPAQLVCRIHMLTCPRPTLQINMNQSIKAEGSFDNNNPQNILPVTSLPPLKMSLTQSDAPMIICITT